MTRIRTYRELRRLKTFEERFEYLALRGTVGDSTFGFDRYINQQFYRSREWRRVRQDVILRDEGCDLGIPDRDIRDKIIIHHMNPMLPKNIIDDDESILDPDVLICVTLQTHNAIHYGDVSRTPKLFVERQPGDTREW